ncbi:CDGSH iron-sulfur domain-containing protein [Arthrobacter sp. AET 35A]|uniref:CDGSH iron-sulfur domain-containing protein n=1 Tax=Arthrobacter sp. AET 35A TaxID=2292643 RepID=UPI0017860FBE|nr:CDGSH iron-sulfur domain-containing protein [Arthrobacter sp. AET 35A]MBE0011311.1 CDGSH iron-sulfur domain-containing protein [Arthrobacter sp. AET 35A]
MCGRAAHDDDSASESAALHSASPDSGPDTSAPDGDPARSNSRQTIVAFPDGPLLVRGEFDIVDPDGNRLRRTRKTVALCRCGASMLKPYCDGSHKMINFKTEPES